MSKPEAGHLGHVGKLRVIAQAERDGRVVKRLETHTIVLEINGVAVSIVKPELRALAKQLGVSLDNRNGNRKNTRSLGADVIKALSAEEAPVSVP